MKKETSCINSRVIFNYFDDFRNGDYSGLLGNLDQEIDSLEDPVAFLRDQNNWISCAVICELYKRTRNVFSDDGIAFKIARHSVENTKMGYTQRIIIKALWSYKSVLKHVQKINDKWNRSKKVELVEMKRSSAVVRLHWDPGIKVTKDLCLVNQGTYIYLPLIWGGNPVELKEEKCCMEGDSCCEYHLQWPSKNKIHEITSRFITTRSVLKETIEEMEKDKKLIEKKYEEINELNRELNHKIKQIIDLHETGKAIISVLDLEKLLDVIMNILSNTCRIEHAIIMLKDESNNSLKYIHSLGFGDKVSGKIADYTVSLDRVSNILVRVMNTGRPEYVPDVEISQLQKDNTLLSLGKPTSAYVVPLITRSKAIGVIASDAANINEGIPLETRETLDIFAPQIAIAIENARLYNKLQNKMDELRSSRAFLRRSEKISFLGKIAANLAHEIKNPMTSIATFLQLLPKKYGDIEFREKFYQTAMEESERVNNLITELLDLTKKRDSNFKYADIHTVIDKMILLISPQSNQKGIEVIKRYDTGAKKILIDSEKIKQAILNLLTNAIDFTPKNGRIEVMTRNENNENSPKNLIIEIQDTGIGIPDSIADDIFDPYFSAKKEQINVEGTGLGLFITHQNIQDHGGTIQVRQGMKKGAAFRISLPYDANK